MDATEGALLLLEPLERNDLAGLKAGALALRRARVDLKEDGLQLVERAIALDNPQALRILLRLGSGDHHGNLFGHYCYGFLGQLIERCLATGRLRIVLELLAQGTSQAPPLHDEDLVERIAHAAIVEFGLDDDTVAAIARACATNRGAFLLHAMQSDRPSLLLRLASTCTPSQNFGAYRRADVPLFTAAELGATYAVRALVAAGAKPNVALRDGGYPLHNAIQCERLPSGARAELVHELLRLGAVPELCDPSGMNAYARAESCGDQEVLSVLRTYGLAYGPRQSREARARGVRDIRLVYDKADGLIYRIGQPDVPFLVGGDYDGIGPCSLECFRSEFEKLRHSRPGTPLTWFAPFLQRLERGQEFGYDELTSSAPGVQVVRFDENSNWSQMVD